MAQLIRFTNAYPSTVQRDNTQLVNMDRVTTILVEPFEVPNEPDTGCLALRLSFGTEAPQYVAYLGPTSLDTDGINDRLQELVRDSATGHVRSSRPIWSPERDAK